METKKQSILFHKRSITGLCFHPDGDLFFASSKDSSASMSNMKGEILGSFEKHEGSISTLAVKENTLLTAGLDLSFISWDIETGSVKASLPSPSVIRGIDFDEQIILCTDNSMNKEAVLSLFDTRSNSFNVIFKPNSPTTKIFKYNNYLIYSTTDGYIKKVDIRNNQEVQESRIHREKITSLRPSACRSFFVTASSDSSVKIIDSDNFGLKKRFDCNEPINSACIFSTNDKVIAVGGIDARDVTTTQGKSTFDTNLYDVVTQKKVGSFTTHFGTINAVDVHPKSTHYISGGEDGSICLIKLGKDFYDAPFTKFDQ